MSSATIHTVAIGGAAGDGIREAGLSMTQFFHELGLHIFSTFDYPSLIRGGHNFSRISISSSSLSADYHELDTLIATNAESVHIHLPSLSPHSLVFVETAYAAELQNLPVLIVPVPMKEITESLHAPLVARTSVALGAYAYTLGISLPRTKDIAQKVFANLGADTNVALVEQGYLYLCEKKFTQHTFLHPASLPVHEEVIDGNRAVVEGFLAVGLEAYVGYPMTPSTSALQFLAKAGEERGVFVVHPEDEIAVLNMALGLSYAGKRVAVGTANGGFALMQETFSLAGIAEIPITILVSMRMGPATGVATHTSQGDLHFILNAGHGEFPRLVLAPGDVEECFTCSADALNLAWKYQIPTIVLSDKHLSESTMSVTLDRAKKGPDLGKRSIHTGGNYLRYKQTADGVSPLAFPGKEGVTVKVTSYEHNEEGEATEESRHVKEMQDKRFRKLDELYKEFAWFPTIKTYGNPESDIVLVCWGSTKGAVLEAMRLLPQQVKMVQVLWMEPFDADRVKRELAGARVIIGIEANHTAQLCALIREKTSIEIYHKVLKYDAQPFTPTELAKEIQTFF